MICFIIRLSVVLIKFLPFSYEDFQVYAKRAVRAYADDKSARRLYEKLGFKETNMMMMKRLA
jgi:hypothetical protein